MSKAFKILAIDGGGFRGVYSAHLLKRIEEEFSVDWRNDFDLLAGTSTGSIIAASLALGKGAGEVLDMYSRHGAEIFRKPFGPRLGLLASKYPKSSLRSVLENFFDNAKLGDIKVPLIIPATDIANGGVHVFKSSYHNEFLRDKDVCVADAVLASCSAPTYFPPMLLPGEKPYLLADGGLWANSPSLVAAIDAKRRLDASLEDLRVLSVGTGQAKSFYPIKAFRGRGIFGWGFAGRWGRGKFIEMLLNLQSETANNMLGLLLKQDQILRLNFDSDKRLPLDRPEDFDDLVTRADREFTHRSALIQEFITLAQEKSS
ncbi:MAG: patatin-like phospholipase family protein [Thermoanaerobaculales bacterium]|nr:patatin-like phospholipase family protein [Thermoanaerobaculales bacterium]